MSSVREGYGPVVARIVGGLGNQMFQYSAARAIALRSGVRLLLDLRSFESYGLRQPGLFHWRVQATEATPRDLRRYPEFALRVARRSKPVARILRSYSEPSLRYDENCSVITAPVHLSGYFQSERYFLNVRDQLLQEFVPRAGLDKRSEAFAKHAEAVNSVAVHVRRGDYISDPRTSAVHGLCGLDYYREAVEMLLERTGPVTFFVFSDDMEWAKRELDLPGPVVYVEGNIGSPEVDMHLMSRCRHVICANSSFSWWGAWLSESPEKIVIAPQRWFAATELDSTDIVPPTWLRVGQVGEDTSKHG